MKAILLTLLAVCLLTSPAALADPLQGLGRYEYGQDQAGLLALEREVEQSMADPQRQAEMAAQLLAVMTDPDATLAGKQHAGILLRLCGGEAQVPSLAAMLSKGRLGEFARGALERIAVPAAGKALREALGTVEGKSLIGIIHSTANRGDREAVGALVSLTVAENPAVAGAAAHALGRIGGDEATACLKDLAKPGAPRTVLHAYLSCGFTALAEGDRLAAAAVFNALAGEPYPATVRRGALAGQLRTADDSTDLLARWLDSDDPVAHRVAIDHLAGQSTEWLLAACKDKPGAQAMAFAEVLAARGETASMPILLEAAAQDDDPATRLRALMALGQVADDQAVSLLVDALGGDGLSSRAAMTALCRVPCTLLDDAVAGGLRQSDGARRARLIDLLVVRRMTGTIPILLELASIEDDAALRDDVSAALIALGNDATLPGLVETVLAAEDAQHRDRIETTYLEIAKRHGDTVEPILAAMTGDGRTDALLPMLGRVGGEAALAKIEQALASDNADRKAAGIRALCNWPDASVAERLAQLAKEGEDRGVRVNSLRAYIRVVSLDSDRPDNKTLEMLQWAFAAAERPDEKVLVADRVSTVRTMETLRWLVKLLDNEAVAQEACRSIVDLAHHRDLRNPNRDEFVKALRRVIEVSKDASTVSRAKGYIEGV